MSYLKLGIAGAILLAFVTIGAVAYKYRGDAIQAEAARAKIAAELVLAVQANESNLRTIADLQERERRDNVILAQIFAEIEAINRGVADTSQAIVDLEKANADVRAYLGTVVPPDLGLRLDR